MARKQRKREVKKTAEDRKRQRMLVMVLDISDLHIRYMYICEKIGEKRMTFLYVFLSRVTSPTPTVSGPKILFGHF